MAIHLIPPERFEQVQQALREQARDSAKPNVANEQAVLTLGEPEDLVYRGKRFRVSPTSYKDGQRLQTLSRAFETAARNDLATPDRVDALVESAVKLCGELVRPRWLRWLPSPFRHASEKEVGDLLGFFHSRRFASGVHHQYKQADPPRRRQP